ncbi:Retinol dehydrogenase 8 [Holothuria leucospilota]|uniref:Retinol dehydrogenase 8 n=1 Tax=Holothuria leucospilota TaxID=206669 RepID=A0A9Q0YS99_HOLLE|nr:Retinol dehydrogenase 8 [Holothuria leucospilota]
MKNLQKKAVLEKKAGESLNKSLFIRELDISNEESILKFLKETYATEGRIDILINNAGIGQSDHFEHIPLKDMQTVFQTNVFGTMRITQEVMKKMKEKRSGHIIFISSILGVFPVPFCDIYIASKFAIEGLVGCLAPVLRAFNISVTDIQPGPVDTPGLENIIKNKLGSFEQEGNPKLDLKVDKETHAMKLAYWDKFMVPLFQRGLQSSHEVAEVIKKCIYEKNPRVLIQTNEVTEKMIKEVLADPTGDKAVEYMASL